MATPKFFTPAGYGEQKLQQFHYSQVVRIGDRVETAGQGGWNDDLSYPPSIREEIINAFENLTRCLELAGAKWEEVFHVNSYHVPMSDEALTVMVEQFRARMPHQAPIWTCLGVPALGDPKMRVEIRVTAIVREVIGRPLSQAPPPSGCSLCVGKLPLSSATGQALAEYGAAPSGARTALAARSPAVHA